MQNKHKDEERVFKVVAKLKNRAERTTYLQELCAGDTTLLNRVQALLNVADGIGDFLETPVLEMTSPYDELPLTEGVGSIIGRYKLLEKIGEGGMAVVYMAEQTEPIRRKVALKIIKLGMDTNSVIARFEAERQALAMMDHPNIAKVLDAGATETGRPYFVMELVIGVSITEYCDRNNLSTKDRLALFIQVCNAVQHAHQKGIIHRDIKPTNVMVTLHDGRPMPKVIDFGIAKATNQRLTEKTLFTRYAHIIGTPAYMSPEQADLSDMDIDTRTDVYSLGVLLYELLTGTTPFSEEELRKAGYIEMQRIIREQEPTKPSTKLSILGDTLTDIAKYRACTPDLLRKSIRGDLDLIVMKSLEKPRDKRYDNISALMMDIQRHLDNQPILARAPSTIYCLQKFLRRHQSSAAAILLASVFSVILLAMFLEWSRKDAQLSVMHRIILGRAINSLLSGDLDIALSEFESLFDSKTVGAEARHRHEETLAAIRKKVSFYTEEITTYPGNAENYLLRAQQYFCLKEKENMIADMEMYIDIRNPLDETNPHDLLFREFLIGLWQSTPTNEGLPFNSSYDECIHCFSANGLTFYAGSDDRPGGKGDTDIYIYTRDTMQDNWSEPENLTTINSAYSDNNSSITADGLWLYFSSNRPGGQGEWDIWMSTRKTTEDDWGMPLNPGPPVNSAGGEFTSCISADGRELYFGSNRSGGSGDLDLWVTRRASDSDAWEEPVNLGPVVNSPYSESRPNISADKLRLFFVSKRPDGYGDRDIWATTRVTPEDDWRIPVNLGPSINSSASEQMAIISPDRSVLYFNSSRYGVYGNFDIWQVKITPSSEVFQGNGDAKSGQKPIQSND